MERNHEDVWIYNIETDRRQGYRTIQRHDRCNQQMEADVNGDAEWISDSIVSLGIEDGICREFADCALVEMETSVSNERLDKIYQKNITSLNENLQEGLALGSFVLRPLGESAAEFVSADKIIPISFGDDGKPNDIAF